MNADLEKLQESNKTELERRGSIFNIGAPATEAVSYTHLTLPTNDRV